jgi:hypothetical protein
MIQTVQAYKGGHKNEMPAIGNHSVSEAYRFYKETINTLNQLPETEEYKQEKLEVLNLVLLPITLLGFYL